MKKYLLFIILSASVTAYAQFTHDPALNVVVRDSAGPEEVVPIAAGVFGEAYVTYFNQNNSGSYDFSMQHINETGSLRFAPSGLTISNQPQNSAIFVYDTKADNSGNVITAFQDERSGQLDVTAYKIDNNGNFIWGNLGIQLHDSASSGGIAPNVGILDNNNAVIAWVADGAPKDWISFRKFSPAGYFQWSSMKRIIDSTGVASFSRPQIIAMDNDEFMMIYVKQTGSGLPASTMYAQRFDANGDPVWPNAVQISSKLIGFAYYPSVTSDLNNGAYIAYTSGNPSVPSYNDVYVQHIDENGNLWSTDGTEACTSTTTQRMSPTIRLEHNWQNPYVLIKETDGSQNSAGITVQCFDTSGNRLYGPNGYSVTPITAAYDEPYDMRFNFYGDDLIILYTEGTFGNQQLLATSIYANSFPSPAWNPVTTVVSSTPSNKSRAQLIPFISIIDGPEYTIAVWEDDRLDAGIYSHNINSDGTLGLFAGINELNNSISDIRVYPNPSSEEQIMQITSSVNEKVSILLTDMSGRTISVKRSVSIVNGKNELDLSSMFDNKNIATGVYILKISGTNINVNTRFIRSK